MSVGIETFATPFGLPLQVRAGAHGVEAVGFVLDDKPQTDQPNALTRQAGGQLREYFAGTRTAFDVPLAPLEKHAASTAYRRSVWSILLTIPYGETWSYSDLAARAGGSPRSAGTANGANTVSILIPCHRVIRRDGSPGGYGGTMGPRGGPRIHRRLLDLKRQLLEHEALHS